MIYFLSQQGSIFLENPDSQENWQNHGQFSPNGIKEGSKATDLNGCSSSSGGAAPDLVPVSGTAELCRCKGVMKGVGISLGAPVLRMGMG